MPTTTVLVVEDDPAIRRGLVDALGFAGFTVLEADNGPDGLSMAIESPVDLVLLDVMLPGLDGLGVLRGVRESRPTLPVIMVTARGGEEDRIRGLTDGADDYVVKPFSAREVIARVEAVLRRSPERPSDVHRLQLNGCSIDLSRREVTCGSDEPRQLTEREADILRYLASHRERAVDRRELLHHVWGLDPRGLQTRTVDMHIARLRDKVEHDPAQPGIVLTVRGKGYMLSDDVVVEPS